MMKSILRSASPDITEGVGSGEYDPRVPAEEDRNRYSAVCTRLSSAYLSVFTGREVRFGHLCWQEEAQTRYTESNYRDALY